MSIFGWLLVAIVAYLVRNVYQRAQYSRKKNEFIRDRRRAAGIPDDDHRPFAVARAGTLSRRSQQNREEALSTPIKRRVLKPSNSQPRIDREAASRLSGIPGTLPGYLKDNISYGTSHTADSTTQGSPSSVKIRNTARSSPQKTMKRQHSQTLVDQSRSKRSEVKDAAEGSPSARLNRKRHIEASPIEPQSTAQGKGGLGKAQKVSVPGDFGRNERMTDEEMSAASDTSEAPSTAMEEDEEDEYAPRASDKVQTKQNRAPLPKLETSARSTAKKREADELDESDIEGSVDTLDGDEHAEAQPHKRSRRANHELDPSSALDFDIAPPDEAMADFDPAATLHFASTGSNRVGSQKRQADTSDDRQPGEEWIDYEGLHWRINPETHQLERNSDVLEWRSKYRMPRDSLHPMAKESHQVIVQKWLSKTEWEDAKAKKLLSFQESERLAEKERLDKEEVEKMKKKQELLAKIRETKSPNKRIQTYLAQKSLQHKLSRSELGDISMASVTEVGDAASMSVDTSSVLSTGEGTPGKPKSRRIPLGSRMTPTRGGGDVSIGSISRDGGVSGTPSPSDSPRRRGSPLTSPYRSIAYPKMKSSTASPLVSSFASSNDVSSS